MSKAQVDAAIELEVAATPTNTALALLKYYQIKCVDLGIFPSDFNSLELVHEIVGYLRDLKYRECIDKSNQALKNIIDNGVNPYIAAALESCAWAIHEDVGGFFSHSLGHLMQANFYYGIAIGSVGVKLTDGNPASQLAHILHERTTRKERSLVEKFWQERIDPKLSAQKAADKISASEVTTLSHKKIAEIVSALRKKEVVRKA